MKPAKFDEILALWSEHDTLENDLGDTGAEGVEQLVESLNAYFADKEQQVSVLGVDIYQYSRYDNGRQRLIPSVFRFSYEMAKRFCQHREEFLFQDQQFEDNFISTGDGGFQIFATPLHALVFAAYFQVALNGYNSFFAWPRVRNFVGALSLRYAITTGSVFRQDSNFYGSAIINNARILSRDALNRLLIDSTTVDWFHRSIGSVESLLMLSREELQALPVFAEYKPKESKNSLIFSTRSSSDPSIRSLHLQKIGLVAAKNTQLDVYNLQVQIGFTLTVRENAPTRRIVVSLGNLNTTGISA